MKWIPTSERLPSERGEYLVTVDFEGDTYVECFHYGKPIMANREVKDECFYDSDDEWGDVVYDTGTEVIAWMPLPEPYTADRKTEPQTYTINPKEPTNMPKCFDCEDFFTCDGQCDKVECEKCKHFREEAEMYTHQCEFYFMECKFEPKDEPQTDCSWK